MNTCRLCKDYESREQLFKYSIRHYAHAKCALAKWGAQFFDMLPAYQLKNLPFLAIVRAGLEAEYRAALAKVQS